MEDSDVGLHGLRKPLLLRRVDRGAKSRQPTLSLPVCSFALKISRGMMYHYFFHSFLQPRRRRGGGGGGRGREQDMRRTRRTRSERKAVEKEDRTPGRCRAAPRPSRCPKTSSKGRRRSPRQPDADEGGRRKGRRSGEETANEKEKSPETKNSRGMEEEEEEEEGREGRGKKGTRKLKCGSDDFT